MPNTRVSPRPTARTHDVRKRPAPRMSPRPRPARRVASGPRPDRVAFWAVGLGIFLIFVAVATSKASPGPADAHRSAQPAPIHALAPR